MATLTIDRAELRAGLSYHVASKRATLPAWAGVLVTKYGMRTYGSEAHADYDWLRAEGDGWEPVVMPTEYLKALAVGKGTVALSDDVTIGKGDDFPPIPATGELFGEIDGEHFARCARSVLVTDERPILQCVNLQARDGLISATSADGFRLSHGVVGTTADDVGWNLNVPGAYAKHIAKLGERVRLFYGVESGWIEFAAGFGSVFLRKQEGTFPNIDSLIPDASPGVRVDAKEMTAALKELKPLAKDNGDIVRLYWEGDHIRAVAGTETSRAERAISARSSDDGTGFPIAFNVNYLIDALKDGAFATLMVTGKSAPARIDIGSMTHVVMPMFVAL